MIRRLHWDRKVPGTCVGTKAAAASSLVSAVGSLEKSQISSSLPYKSRENTVAPEDFWMFEVFEGNKDEVGDTRRRCSPTEIVDTG